MTDMVERVARVLASASGDDFWKYPPYNQLHTDAGNNHWRHKARAAIGAMREPTDAMLAAGDLPGWDDSVTVGLAGEVWRAMVDAALTPSTPVRDGDVTVKTEPPEDAGSVR